MKNKNIPSTNPLFLFCFFSPQGNLTFGVDGDVILIENSKLVSVIKDLLSTKEENVQKALLYRTVATARDVIEKEHTEQEASYGRDALAKVTVFLVMSKTITRYKPITFPVAHFIQFSV